MSEPLTMPSGLGKDGRRLWRAMTKQLDYDQPAEVEMLAQACRLADDVARLRAELAGPPPAPLTVTGVRGAVVEQPLLASIRQGVALQAKLLSALVATGSADTVGGSSSAARELAMKRWSRDVS